MRTYSKTQKYSIAHNFFNVDHNTGMLHFKMIVLMRGIQLNKNCSHLSYPFSQKLNIMKLLFSFPNEIFSPKPVFGSLFICSFKFLITYIWADTEKCPFSSNCSFSVSSCIHTVKLRNIRVRCVLFRTLWYFILNLSCLFPLQIFHIWT